MSVPPGSRMTTFSLPRIARTVKYGEAMAAPAKMIARTIQNLAATRLLVIASMAENFIALDRLIALGVSGFGWCGAAGGKWRWNGLDWLCLRQVGIERSLGNLWRENISAVTGDSSPSFINYRE